MKHKKCFLSLLLSFSFVFALASCNGQSKNEGATSVTFDLNGGKYKNSQEKVTYNYKLTVGSECLIKDPDSFNGTSSSTIVPNGNYHIKNWFVAGEDGNATSTSWNFETDKIKYGDKITLIANWVPNTKYLFNVYYKDASGTTQDLTSLSVDAGQNIDAYTSDLNKACRNKNITFLGQYYDADGNEIESSSLVMPEESDIDVIKNVYISYIEGRYILVNDYSSLNKALASSTRDNIYLLNDIDCGGQTLKLGSNGVLNNLTIKGNGYTIKNFMVNYDTSRTSKGIKDYNDGQSKILTIGLFNTITNSTIENVKFEDAIIDINYRTDISVADYYSNIVISPLTYDITNSNILNVTINAKYKIGKLPNNIKADGIIINENYCVTDPIQSKLENVSISLTKEE